MLKTRIILVVVSAVLVVVLFLLPRVVVDNDDAIAAETPADSISREIEMHANVPAEILAGIKNLRGKYSPDSKNEKNAIFADSLANLYAIAGRFDSSAWYAEEAAKFFNKKESWIKAGDQYYQAYSFALDAARQAQYAAKAQSYYNMVLARYPEELDVKTKLAMTYLSDSSPMKAITALREVLEKDPKNELALYNMGMLSIESGQYDRAVERLKFLTEINPAHIQGNLLLGVAYMNTGAREKAREQFEKVKLLDRDPSVQQAVDAYLKDLK